jgi:hypothetical protein
VHDEGQNVKVWDIVSGGASGGRQVAVRLAGRLAGQERSLANARRASTEVSRRRVERDEVTIYLDGLRAEAEEPRTRTARSRTAQTAD